MWAPQSIWESGSADPQNNPSLHPTHAGFPRTPPQQQSASAECGLMHMADLPKTAPESARPSRPGAGGQVGRGGESRHGKSVSARGRLKINSAR